MPRKDARLAINKAAKGLSTVVEQNWESFDGARKISRFMDEVLALAELPPKEEWAKIFELSVISSLPSIWLRCRHSTLEMEAAKLITALAFASRNERQKTVGNFLEVHGWKFSLPGRPQTLDARLLTDISRGKQIDEIVDLFKQGFRIKLDATKRGGFVGGDEAIAAEIKKRYNLAEDQIEAILQQKTLKSAGCYYYKMRHEPTVELKSIRNSYSRYKHSK